MNSRMHGSEEALAERGCAGLERVRDALRAGRRSRHGIHAPRLPRPAGAGGARRRSPSWCRRWCAGTAARWRHLAARPLDDARVHVLEDDVGERDPRRARGLRRDPARRRQRAGGAGLRAERAALRRGRAGRQRRARWRPAGSTRSGRRSTTGASPSGCAARGSRCARSGFRRAAGAAGATSCGWRGWRGAKLRIVGVDGPAGGRPRRAGHAVPRQR